ncbi:hypothetical protein BAE44_0004275 [Dichanthelium oligosanthes]|uniref:RRM domain-containing protein n=1 Tax=Dichanthelium oligosanthes TaxID=888268 RepID=A0A1E5WBA3_9POAL|nr:hypothetical protein BAE44_0004275 [Dichanthelium oligosanthes]
MPSHPYLKKVRRLFSQLLVSLGIDPSLSMMIIAFWMFVKENGCVDFFECINAFDDFQILIMIAFVRKCVDVLVHLESSDSNTSSPSREKVVEGIDFYLNNTYEAVGDILNDFEIHKLIYEYAQDHDAHLEEEIYTRLGIVTNLAESSSQAHNTQGQGTSAHILETIEEETTLPSSTDSLGETLDSLGIIKNADEERTLLVIFSDEYPLSKDELNKFFSWYGVIQEIAIEEPSLRPDPLCALVTCRSSYPPITVLNGDKRVHFIINGKDVWVQHYVEDKRARSI